MLWGTSALGRAESEMRCSWCKALAGWGAAVCWGLLLSTLKHGFGRGLMACCQPQLACPSLSSFLLTPPAPAPLLHALKSHFQARRRINLWALHIAGSWKQDVGSFFSLSFSLSASWLTFLPLEEFGRPWDPPTSSLQVLWSFSARWSPCCGFTLIDFICWCSWHQYQTILHVIWCISWGNLQDIY